MEPKGPLRFLQPDGTSLAPSVVNVPDGSIENGALTITFDPGYLEYTALMTQSGTSAPVATVLSNTTSLVGVPSYEDVGSYLVVFVGSSLFADPSKVQLPDAVIRVDAGAYKGDIRFNIAGADALSILVADEIGDPANGWFGRTINFAFRVYP